MEYGRKTELTLFRSLSFNAEHGTRGGLKSRVRRPSCRLLNSAEWRRSSMIEQRRIRASLTRFDQNDN